MTARIFFHRLAGEELDKRNPLDSSLRSPPWDRAPAYSTVIFTAFDARRE